jgi:outer membrane biosynthesis protein TonB
MNSLQREAKDRRIAGILTLIIYAILLAIFIFTVVWTRPDPPPFVPTLEIEGGVNFGKDNAGSGKVQSQSKANNNKNLEDARPSVTRPAATNESKPVTQPIERTPERVEQPTARPVTTEDRNSPDVREEKKPSTQPVTTRPSEQPQKSEQPSNTDSGKGTGDKNTANNNGNVSGATGDQGKPDGSLNNDALLGSGGGSGTSLDLAGWTWDTKPVVNDRSGETGRLEFEIRVDRNGEVVGVRLLFRSVSPSIARLYEEALKEVSFRPTSGGSRPSITVGKVVFNITAR